MRPARTARSGFEGGGTWTSTCSGDQLEMVPADTEITQLDLDTSGMTMQTEIYLDGELMDLPDSSQDLVAASEAGGTLTFTCSGNQMQTVPVIPGVDTAAYATVLHRL